MSDDRAAGILSLAHDLERRDADVAARLDDVNGVLGKADDVRASAERVRAALEALPEQLAHARQAADEARSREEDARRSLAEAERRVDEVGRSRRLGEDARVAAERALRRATVAAADAAATVERTDRRVGELAADEAALTAEGEGLAVLARNVSRLVAELPRLSDSGRSAPGTSLAEIAEWGARAHAALFVVRGSLESERERIIAEATSLAAAVLGENVGGTSVALVRRRLEKALVEETRATG